MTFFEVYCFGDDGVFCYGCSHQSQLFKVIRNQGKCRAFPNDFMVCNVTFTTSITILHKF